MSRTIRNEPRAKRSGRDRNPIPRRRIAHAPTRAMVRALQSITSAPTRAYWSVCHE
jgi:hypothetical protein